MTAEPYVGIIATDRPFAINKHPEFFCEQLFIRPGMKLPARVPLIDSHMQEPLTIRVLGWVENLRVEAIPGEHGQGLNAIVGDIYFSKINGQIAKSLVDEGAVWGLSVSVTKDRRLTIPRGETRTIEGATFHGGLVVYPDFEIPEISLCVSPKDRNCKIFKQQEIKQ